VQLRLLATTTQAIREQVYPLHRKATGHAVYADYPACPICAACAATVRQNGHTQSALHNDASRVDMGFLLALELFHLQTLATVAGPLYTPPERPRKDPFGTALAGAWGYVHRAQALLHAEKLDFLIHRPTQPTAQSDPRTPWDHMGN
jgi:hypothetical protein